VTPSGSTGTAGSPAFVDSLKSAIGKVNETQLEAGRAVDALMTGETQDLHRTMVALQQADVSFQLMMQIRNKLVAAYEEIQRMQV
jgi:flagellar hook-basal body complex protein FliE